MNRFAIAIACFLALSSIASQAYGLAFEEFGNRPFPAASHEHWPGIMPLINSEARIYYREVNGNERFHFKGGTGDLNLALKNFVAAKSKSLQVVFRPGPANVQTFDGVVVDCNWILDLRRGFTGARRKGDQNPPNSLVLNVYVDDDIDLQRLEIPDGITLMNLAQQKEQCWNAMFDSSDSSVRGSGCWTLASLDPYDSESVKLIRVCLRDRDPDVHSDAADALAVFGAKAKPALVELRQMVTRSSQRGTSEAAKNAISAIEAAPERSEAEHKFRTAMREIEIFIKVHHTKP